jgi:hypothetical protein
MPFPATGAVALQLHCVRQRVVAAIGRIAKGCAITTGLAPDKMPVVNVELRCAKEEFGDASPSLNMKR